MYEQEVEFLSLVEDEKDESNQRRVLFSEQDCLEISQRYKKIPKEYLAYLKEIGSGTVREQQYVIYDNPALHDEDDRFSWYEPRDYKEKNI